MFAGNGHSFVWTLAPDLRTYGWTRADEHYALAAAECIAFGSPPAALYALASRHLLRPSAHDAHRILPCYFFICDVWRRYLDSSLEHGASRGSPTYGNEPLAGALEFKAIKVELWAFV